MGEERKDEQSMIPFKSIAKQLSFINHRTDEIKVTN